MRLRDLGNGQGCLSCGRSTFLLVFGQGPSRLWSSMISYNEAMLGLVRKKLVIVVLLAVSFAAGFAIGVSMWEGEPATEEKSKSGEPAIHAT